MAVWSEVVPLTASCLSPLPRFIFRSGHVRRLPVTLGKVLDFARYSGFPHQFQMTSDDLAAI